MQGRIEKYIEQKGDRFTVVWLTNFLPRINGDGNVTNQVQTIGLGAVLITTVTFAAAFTLPGGYDSNGSPVFGRKYFFKAFIVANTLAFIRSFLCVIMLMYGGVSSMEAEVKHSFLLSGPLALLSGAAKCIVVALGLGLYLTLATFGKWFSTAIIVWAFFAALLDEGLKFQLQETQYGVDYQTGISNENLEKEGFFFSIFNFCLPTIKIGLVIFLTALIPW